ncbi:hypothetical protein LCGC14_3083320, partial [marine sediment metagenome]
HLELAKKTFLYLHTSYPDVGYDISKAIRDFKVGNKVIMTYLCTNCQTAYPSFFAGELTVCRKCGKLTAHTPNAEHSCPRSVLAGIMQSFDMYVQYSICEGFGMPCIDAIGCGVPVAAVDSAITSALIPCTPWSSGAVKPVRDKPWRTAFTMSLKILWPCDNVLSPIQ